MSIIKGILDVGAVVILPIVMLILCLIFRMPFGKSLKASLMIGIGFSGLSLVIGFLMTSVQSAQLHSEYRLPLLPSFLSSS